MYQLVLYKTSSGKEVVAKWLDSFKDNHLLFKIMQRIRRLELGYFGDYKFLSQGLYELRFNFGPGYRIYYTIKGRQIILLYAGYKNSQKDDIKKSRIILQEILNE